MTGGGMWRRKYSNVDVLLMNNFCHKIESGKYAGRIYLYLLHSSASDVTGYYVDRAGLVVKDRSCFLNINYKWEELKWTNLLKSIMTQKSRQYRQEIYMRSCR